ncbi:unnamed protein product [Chrysoparadoxa australica]
MVKLLGLVVAGLIGGDSLGLALGLTCCNAMVVSSPNRCKYRTGGSLGLATVLSPGLAEIQQSIAAQAERTRALAVVAQLEGVFAAAVTKANEVERSDSGILESIMEVGLGTFGSFLSGGVLGYVIGFGKGIFAGGHSGLALLKAVHKTATTTGGNWGSITACFAGFGGAARVVRNKDDKWNNVIGSCGTGAFMCRGKGPNQMAQGCLSYALCSYFFDSLAGPSGDNKSPMAQPNRS